MGVPVVDTAEILSTQTNYWTDGIHLTSAAYTEVGNGLTALFGALGVKDVKHVSGGATINPYDQAFGIATPATYSTCNSVPSLSLDPGQILAFPLYFDTPSQVTVMACAGTSAATIGIHYAQDLVPGFTTATIPANTTVAVAGMSFARGYRTIVLRNEGAATLNINALSFSPR